MGNIIKTYSQFLLESSSAGPILKTNGEIDSANGLTLFFVDEDHGSIASGNIVSLDNAFNLDIDVPRFYKSNQYCLEPEDCDFSKFNNRNTAYFYGTIVLPEFRRMGLAQRLKEEAHRILKDSGYEYVLGLIDCTNEPSLNLHHKLGYVRHQTDGKYDAFFKKL